MTECDSYFSMHYIYVVRNSVNTKVYVGQTRNFAQRKALHLYCTKKGDQKPLYCAIREIGIEKFTFDLLEECSDATTASQREAHWVAHFDSIKNGYNLTSGGGYHVGNRGRKFTAEHRRKIGEAHQGKIVSLETKQKIAAVQRGKKRGPHSDETKAKISQANHNRIVDVEVREKIRRSLIGRSPSPETRQKISEAGRGRKHSPETIEKMKTHIFTEEHRRKLSEAAKRRAAREREERNRCRP